MEISVIICTHNPRPKYLARVIKSLCGQTLSLEQWELLIVDNASRKPLTAAEWDLSWHPNARIVREDEVGLSPARMRGMREATGKLLVFVDDDNLLDSNYLMEVLRIGREWPQLGVWGGSIAPEFEVEPPDYIRSYLGLLALREIKSELWSNISTCDAAEPWGAGMCVRVCVAAEYCKLYTISTIRIGDRSGGNLLSGGDTEICYVACSLGLGKGLFPTLKVIHLIPKERFDEDYLVKITEGIQTSLHLINFKWNGIPPSSPFAPLNFLGLCRHLILKRGIYRRIFLASIRARISARTVIAATRKRANA
jgi:glycosyltransferase involved in cell wall biosynthesis